MEEYLTSEKAIDRDISQRGFIDLSGRIMRQFTQPSPASAALTIYN